MTFVVQILRVTKPIKLLEENVRQKCPNIGFGNNLLNM